MGRADSVEVVEMADSLSALMVCISVYISFMIDCVMISRFLV